MALLGAFDEEHRRLSLTALADRAELPAADRASAGRRAGRVGSARAGASGEYVVGRRLWDLGLLAPVQTGLRQVASPFLHDLYGATLATVHLAVRDGDEVLYLDRLAGNASVPVVSTIGSRLPMHATGVGKVLLAHAPADVQAAALARPGPGDAVHRHAAGPPAPPARAGAARGVRHHGGGDEPRRVLGGGADPPRATTWSRRSGIVVPSLKKDRPQLVAALQVAARGVGQAPRRASDQRKPRVAAGGHPGDSLRFMRTQVAIIGAGPAGMLLSHLLAAEGVESVVLETRSQEYVASRIRAGILEQSTVDLLRSVGLGERLDREAFEHRGIYLQWPEERHHLDFVDLTGRSVFVYGQTQVQKDLVAARTAAGQDVHYEISDTALHDLESDRAVGDVHGWVGGRRSG